MSKVPRPVAVAISLLAAGLAGTAPGSCGERSGDSVSPHSVEVTEEIFQQARELWDQVDVTRNRGATVSTGGVALADLIGFYTAARADLQQSRTCRGAGTGFRRRPPGGRRGGSIIARKCGSRGCD